MDNKTPLENPTLYIFLASDEVTDPLSIFMDFFSTHSKRAAKGAIEQIMEVDRLEYNQIYRRMKKLGDFTVDFGRLVEAAYMLKNQKRNVKQIVSIKYKKQLKLEHLFLDLETLWDDFPRHLSWSDFLDPHTFLSEFFDVLDLNECHREMSEACARIVGNEAVEDGNEIIKILLLRERFLAFIDICHLIYIRQFRLPKAPLQTITAGKNTNNKKKRR